MIEYMIDTSGEMDLYAQIPSLVYDSGWKTYKVEFSRQYRPDKISNDYYGTDSYWWAIAMANGIVHPWKFQAAICQKYNPITYGDNTVTFEGYAQSDRTIISDLVAGQVIYIPSTKSIVNFINTVSK